MRRHGRHVWPQEPDSSNLSQQLKESVEAHPPGQSMSPATSGRLTDAEQTAFPQDSPSLQAVPYFTGFEKNEPPLAQALEPIPAPSELPGQLPAQSVQERLLPDTITIKEKNGSTSQIPEAKNASADERLNSYLQSRGAQLSELDLNASSVTDKGLGLLSKAPNLTKLMLNDCNVDDESMKVLGKQGLRNMQELNLHSTRVGDDGVAQLKGMPLKVLNIADTATSDDCMKHIKTMKNLQVLSADYSGVGNEGVKAIKEMQNLRSVSLKGCPITDACVKDLSQCQNLMLLNLEDTRLSAAKVLWLQRQMPRCVVIPPDGQGAAKAVQPPIREQHHRENVLQNLFEPRSRR
jgi:hypothetical protein